MLNSKKTYYSIREVCEITKLEPHVLRYWEGEFTVLHPKKNRAGNRAYRDKDIELIVKIKKLLYEEEYTIQGAKKKLAALKFSDDSMFIDDAAESIPSISLPSSPVSPSVNDTRDIVHVVLQELRELKEILSSNV